MARSVEVVAAEDVPTWLTFMCEDDLLNSEGVDLAGLSFNLRSEVDRLALLVVRRALTDPAWAWLSQDV